MRIGTCLFCFCASFLAVLTCVTLAVVDVRDKAPASPTMAHRCGNPTAPVRIELTPLERRKGDPKGHRRLRVTVTPLVSAPRLEVALMLPLALKPVQGEIHWQAPARAGAAQTRELLLDVPAAGEQRIIATARLVFARSLPMTCARSYTFNEKPARPEPTLEPGQPLAEPETLPTFALSAVPPRTGKGGSGN